MGRKKQKCKRLNLASGVSVVALPVLSGGLVMLVSRSLPSHAVPAQHAPGTSSTPGAIIQRFYADLMTNNYEDAYTLLSAQNRREFEPLGGAAYLEQLFQPFITRYGAITRYTITNQVQGSESDQLIITLQIHRGSFQLHQSERDTCTLLFESGVWSIDQWSTDITTQ